MLTWLIIGLATGVALLAGMSRVANWWEEFCRGS